MADATAERKSQNNASQKTNPPKKGEHYRCASCGMEVEVMADCKCRQDDHAHFACCGNEMTKA